MNYFRIAVLALLFVPGFVCADVRITEIAWMGTANSQYSEWFELYNEGTAAVDLAGWKLVQGDGSIIFTLTKNINPSGYLLVERTTASAPDAVPGINDEAGAFGASGFANNGEDLELVDASGTTIEILNFAGGWPAGDASSKATMQWSDGEWITASATPKSGVSGDGEPAAERESTVVSAEQDPYPIPKVSPNQPHIAFTIPKSVYVGMPYAYKANPVFEYGYNVLYGTYTWNMGDGTRYYQTKSEELMHTYRYPGTYVVSFLYTDPTNTNNTLKGTQKVLVVAPSVTLSIRDAQALEIKNTSSTDLDLSGWYFVTPSTKVSVPEMTIVAAKSSIVIPFTILSIGQPSSVVLLDPSGAVVASTIPAIAGDRAVSSYGEDIEYEYPESFDTVPEEAPAQTYDTPIRNRTRVYIFGAVALFVIGLSILLERVMARQEYLREESHL
jgi:hypothetical protein